MIKNQIFKFRETARRQPEIRIRSGAGGKKQAFVAEINPRGPVAFRMFVLATLVAGGWLLRGLCSLALGPSWRRSCGEEVFLNIWNCKQKHQR
jgi:hypothetical protein